MLTLRIGNRSRRYPHIRPMSSRRPRSSASPRRSSRTKRVILKKKMALARRLPDKQREHPSGYTLLAPPSDLVSDTGRQDSVGECSLACT